MVLLLLLLLQVANLPPQQYTSFDIRRLRPAMSAALGATDRQMVICSSSRSPRFGALLHAFSSNRRGHLELFDPRLAAACMPLDIPPPDCVAAAAAAGERGGKGVAAAAAAAAAAAREAAEAEAAKGRPRGLVPATIRCSRAGAQQLFCRVSCTDFTKIQRARLPLLSPSVSLLYCLLLSRILCCGPFLSLFSLLSLSVPLLCCLLLSLFVL